MNDKFSIFVLHIRSFSCKEVFSCSFCLPIRAMSLLELPHSVYVSVKDNVVRTNVYHKYIKDLKLNITIDLDGFIY